jgi:hypothetical protein
MSSMVQVVSNAAKDFYFYLYAPSVFMNETLVIKPLQNSLQQLLVMYDFMRNKMVIAGMVPLRDQNPI